jgi:hypothetical protein
MTESTTDLRAARMEHAVQQAAELSVRLEDAERERDEHKRDYLNACKTIADMHAAAVGEVRGPARGVVEDVEDVRLRAEQAEAAIDRVRTLHRKATHGDDCVHCAGFGPAYDNTWPCQTIRVLDGTARVPPAPATTEPIVDRPFRSHRPKPAEEPGLVDKDGKPICTCTYGERCPNCRD